MAENGKAGAPRSGTPPEWSGWSLEMAEPPLGGLVVFQMIFPSMSLNAQDLRQFIPSHHKAAWHFLISTLCAIYVLNYEPLGRLLTRQAAS
jgi:hypothetical protein